MKATTIALITMTILIGATIALTRQGTGTSPTPAVNNVSIVDGKQIIVIKAKGGYQPRHSVAKAGVPTILRFDTEGTFDCSSSVRVPSMNISKLLPQTGTTDIDIGTQKVSLLQGTCGMGMYPFEVDFQG